MGNSKSGLKIQTIDDIISQDFFAEDENNGLIFDDKFYLPEDVVSNIISYVPANETLKLALVCKKWCQMTRNNLMWRTKYEREYRARAKNYPWFIYYCLFSKSFFDINLLENGNGQDRFKHWVIVENGGDEFQVENDPLGCHSLPLDIPDFNGHKSCFATSYEKCEKYQIISLKGNLLSVILDQYKPTIYLSEWFCGRFDCACKYSLRAILLSSSDHRVTETGDGSFVLKDVKERRSIQQWADPKWEKIEIEISDYPPGVNYLFFTHSGRDLQFWAGHYGSKFAGGVVKILFDSIKPKEEGATCDNPPLRRNSKFR